MTSNVAFERSFAELSNGHEFSIVKSLQLSKNHQNKLFLFFLCAMVSIALLSSPWLVDSLICVSTTKMILGLFPPDDMWFRNILREFSFERRLAMFKDSMVRLVASE